MPGAALTVDATGLHRLLAWFSPAFPVGAYSYSGGLENAIENGLVTDGSGVAAWIGTALRDGPPSIDCVLFAHAWRAVERDDPDRLVRVGELAGALRGSSELARESAAQGTAFRRAVDAAWAVPGYTDLWTRLDVASVDTTLPIAAATACACAGIDLATGLYAYAHAHAANAVSVGVRVIPLGQTDGQLILAGLDGAIADTVGDAQATALDDLGSAAPMIDLCSMAHEVQHMRLFQS